MINIKNFKEQNYYFLNDYDYLFQDEDVLNQLLKGNVIKFNGNQFKFEFVGVIVIGDNVLCCYPKYIKNENYDYNHFKQVLNVLKKFNKMNNNLFYQNEELSDSSLSLLSLMLFFIEDYYENDVYRKDREIFKVNGNGEIDWNRTINYTYPIIQNGKPYYTELQTRNKLNDLTNYFRLLHECIITECSQYLESKNLLELFNLNTVNLSEKSLHDFGDDNFIKEKLEKELSVEFNTHNRIILNAMISYIDKVNSTRNKILTLYGTNKYWVVWEKMCSKILKNNLEDTAGYLFGNNLNDKNIKEKQLKNIVDFPKMCLDGKNKNLSKLEPDLIIITEKNELYILDAKYRMLNSNTLDDHLKLYDVNKQFLYQLAYSKLICSENIKIIKNALLFPTDSDNVKNRGVINYQMFEDISLRRVQLIDLPASKVNKYFLDEEPQSLEWLELKDYDNDDVDWFVCDFISED